ncbi:uncharacterized protein LOC130976893 [Arachis stenosperma]|uniref:uncharacterized protein LOC130976893 n=1 Tax=Arachis stenosperma TaxID=217475 RepID=UPI0025ABDAB7|nr:uncharacterized protein LOC130976893 [Arachis stenosperma]
MAGVCSRKQFHGYSKMEKEDSEEMIHRRAQFLIYKVLQQADSSYSSSCSRRIRICKLKVKIGNRLRRLRKRILSGFHGFKAWKKRFFAIGSSSATITALPPFIK